MHTTGATAIASDFLPHWRVTPGVARDGAWDVRVAVSDLSGAAGFC